jgi:DNA-binding response OmpR family regulator
MTVAKAILVVEDDLETLAILTESLEAHGYVVLKAVNGRDALDQARAMPPNLILLDMMMPVMSGYDALGALKDNPATAGIPVVGLSAKTSLEDIEMATDMGIDAYITKPFHMERVLSVIEAYL